MGTWGGNVGVLCRPLPLDSGRTEAWLEQLGVDRVLRERARDAWWRIAGVLQLHRQVFGEGLEAAAKSQGAARTPFYRQISTDGRISWVISLKLLGLFSMLINSLIRLALWALNRIPSVINLCWELTWVVCLCWCCPFLLLVHEDSDPHEMLEFVPLGVFFQDQWIQMN